MLNRKKEEFIEEMNILSRNDYSFGKRLFYIQYKINKLLPSFNSYLSIAFGLYSILFSCLFGKYELLHDNLHNLKYLENIGLGYNFVVNVVYFSLLINFILCLSVIICIASELYNKVKLLILFVSILLVFYLLIDSGCNEESVYFWVKFVACFVVVLIFSKKIKYCINIKAYILSNLILSYSQKIDKCVFNLLLKEDVVCFDELYQKVCNLFDLQKITFIYFFSISFFSFISIAFLFVGYCLR